MENKPINVVLKLSCLLFIHLNNALISYPIAIARIVQTVPTKDFSVNENDPISLTCYISGDPTPTVTLKKDRGMVSSYIIHVEAQLYTPYIICNQNINLCCSGVCKIDRRFMKLNNCFQYITNNHNLFRFRITKNEIFLVFLQKLTNENSNVPEGRRLLSTSRVFSVDGQESFE